MTCCGRARRARQTGKVLVRYHGIKPPTYTIVGKATGATYRFRARGTEVLMDQRDFDELWGDDRQLIRETR